MCGFFHQVQGHFVHSFSGFVAAGGFKTVCVLGGLSSYALPVILFYLLLSVCGRV